MSEIKSATPVPVRRMFSSGLKNFGLAELREVDAEQLFMGASSVQIRHAGERYTLRRTSKGKLILTK